MSLSLAVVEGAAPVTTSCFRALTRALKELPPLMSMRLRAAPPNTILSCNDPRKAVKSNVVLPFPLPPPPLFFFGTNKTSMALLSPTNGTSKLGFRCMCVGCKCQSCAAASVPCDRTEILLQSEELFSPVPGVDTGTTYRHSIAVLRCDKQAHRTDQKQAVAGPCCASQNRLLFLHWMSTTCCIIHLRPSFLEVMHESQDFHFLWH